MSLLDPLNSTSSLKGSIGSSHGLDHLHPEVRSVQSAGLLGSTGSFSGGDAISLPGPRLVQELADHLNSQSSDEKKKLVSSLLECISDDCLALFVNRVEVEKKSRRKNGKIKGDNTKENSLKGRKGDKCKDPDVNSNGNNSIGSSSMEGIPESSVNHVASSSSLHSQNQTSPTTGSRKTFAGDLLHSLSTLFLHSIDLISRLFVLTSVFPQVCRHSLLISFLMKTKSANLDLFYHSSLFHDFCYRDFLTLRLIVLILVIDRYAGFLRRDKKDKKMNNKTNKKDKDAVNGNGKNCSTSTAEGSSPKDSLRQPNLKQDSSSLDGNRDSTSSDVKVDEEGYIIPPHLIAAAAAESSGSSKRKEHDRFYSDSDSSDDDEDIKKPIHVIIKPINGDQGLKTTGSIAELKETVKGLSISPSLLPSVSVSCS
jgi:hypothetical protein